MRMNCVKCEKLHKYMIRIALGIKFFNDPDGSYRYSSYPNGMLEERYICTLCLKDVMYGPIGDTSDGELVDES